MTTELKPRKDRPHHTAHQRAQAVLAVWTEHRRPAELCQELGINSAQLGQWQDRALEGMLRALMPRSRSDSERGPLLNNRLEQLLARKAQQQQSQLSRLEKRLSRLQDPKSTPAPSEKA